MDNHKKISLTNFNEILILFSPFRSFSFPGATNETLLQKFNSVHRDNKFYEKPQKKENAFIIRHYAGKVKYQVNYATLLLILFIQSDSKTNLWNNLDILWDTHI